MVPCSAIREAAWVGAQEGPCLFHLVCGLPDVCDDKFVGCVVASQTSAMMCW